MSKPKKLQLVWPKDGPKGRGKRGFRGRLANIVTGKGPGIFLQRMGSTDPIPRDQWQNWDSYRSYADHRHEDRGSVSRGFRRYDPHTRTYVEWTTPHDWSGRGTHLCGGVGYKGDGLPRFTREEGSRFNKAYHRGQRLRNEDMGDAWTHEGPKRFGPKYDEFWQSAHRQAKNIADGYPRQSMGLNPHMTMRSQYAEQPYREWFWDECLHT
ncbi:uncharacterized protein L3040_002201 [Drepanopeziza brunnea f. sp. 'multigermtubi']|uniref:Uncharacterized protein n=1 Tax=Marssonina brunnea f. sp. multigermtubi (strain MB_m1) TaxID=1072389 RepID=K1X4P6_MARBU|nr:uncharacterized protein MBM_02078 [Drepanopeziza brunnea f. sp. 'multigermtubi' MB_m1]EKD20126.1 hypothetical protein MBM_02078 [Drepanopeziza brunnea f. sp. 'multigermtubi' MB_m1]KAJ5050318.1 hypothetical protein L3040_002201 [Drepanopeziza brunnea f. sp. 'multigermtubi']